jgi:hypothetical protein
MIEIPIDVADAEQLVRGICTPHHVSSAGKLKPAAFEAPAESDEVSVIRHDYVGIAECKMRAQALSQPEQGKRYVGLAVTRAGIVRIYGADVVDSRAEFLGHADIRHGYTRSALEPPPPEVLKVLKDRCKALAKAATFIRDPEPETGGWAGSELGLPSYEMWGP